VAADEAAPSGRDAAPGYRDVLRDGAVRRLWLGLLASQLGDSLHLVTLLWLVLELTGSAASVAWVVLGQVAPALVAGLWGGVLADRLDRRRALVLADVGRGALVLSLAAAAAAGALTLPHLVVVAFANGALAQLFRPALQASLPSLVAPSHLTPLNALVLATGQVCGIVGPPLGGALFAAAGPLPALALDAASFFVSAAAILSLRGRLGERPADRPRGRPLDDLREGLAFLGGDGVLRPLLAASVLATLAWGPAPVLLATFAERTLGAGPDGLGLLMAAAGLGGAGGAFGIGRLGARLRPAGSIALGLLLMGALRCVQPFSPSLPVAAAVVAAAAAANWAVVVPLAGVLQRRPPDALRGRVIGAYYTLAELPRPLTLVPAGALVDGLGVAAAYLLTGGLLLVAATLAAGVAARERGAPAAAAPDGGP
jgi:MFS family permease